MKKENIELELNHQNLFVKIIDKIIETGKRTKFFGKEKCKKMRLMEIFEHFNVSGIMKFVDHFYLNEFGIENITEASTNEMFEYFDNFEEEFIDRFLNVHEYDFQNDEIIWDDNPFFLLLDRIPIYTKIAFGYRVW